MPMCVFILLFFMWQLQTSCCSMSGAVPAHVDGQIFLETESFYSMQPCLYRSHHQNLALCCMQIVIPEQPNWEGVWR